ncbi:MAG TPA: type II secretion system minor pseudopilin GspK [Acidiferrobacterales bacterium]|nr:type II secretion system minor pseudopilin GspK [Acidiferrobacterales bacterium]
MLNQCSGANQSGLALITAMLVIAIVVTAAAYLSLGQQIWLRQAQNLADMAQADTVARAGFDLAVILLTQDAKNSATDDLTQTWAQPIPVFPVEGGAVTAAISDAQGHFNLNNLAGTSAGDNAVFRRLLTSQNFNPDLTDALKDWLDSDSNTRPNGAEDNEYLALPTPYRAANQLLQSVDELRLVRGFSAEVVQKLRPWVTVLPVATLINVNTAPAPVLSALCGESLSVVEQWVVERVKNPYTPDRLPPCGQVPAGAYSVKTEYFEVTVQTQFGRLRRQTQALIYRPANGAPAKVLWHRDLMSNTVLPTKVEGGK